MSDSNWFSQAGSLDDSLDSGTTSIPTSVDSAPTSKDSVKSNNVSSTASTYIKPVKGLKEKTVASVRTGSEINKSNSTAMHVTPVKEETRCKKCGAVIPKGTTLCWKCSTSESVAGEKDGKREMNALVSPNEAFLVKNRKPIMIGAAFLVLIIIVGIAVLISKSQKIDLKKLICTDEILYYQLEDGTIMKSSVQSFEVLSSRTKDKHDSSEVKVVLKDDFLERTLYISTESTKYSQGWELDSLIVTQSSFEIAGEIDENYVTAFLSQDRADTEGLVFQIGGLDLVEAGLDNISITSSEIQDASYFLVCEVNDSNKYADIYGTLYVRINVNMFADTYTGSCVVRRSIDLDTESLTTSWHDIYGTYLRSDPEMELEEYITIDESLSAYGYGDYMEFGQQRHNLIDDAKVYRYNYSTIIIQFYSVNGYSIIKITPDEITYLRSGYGLDPDYHVVDSFVKVN